MGHIGYVLDGRLEVSFSASREVFEAGDGVFILPGDEHRHKARALTDTVTLILAEGLLEGFRNEDNRDYRRDRARVNH